MEGKFKTFSQTGIWGLGSGGRQPYPTYVRTYVRTVKSRMHLESPTPRNLQHRRPPLLSQAWLETFWGLKSNRGLGLGSQEQPCLGLGSQEHIRTYVRTYVRKPFWLKDICTALCRASASRGKPLHNYLKDICTGLCRASASRGKPSAIGQNDIPHLLFWKQKKGERKENTYVIEIRTYVRA